MVGRSQSSCGIPYALEDKLAQPVEELHFAFDKAYYHNHHYLIAVMAKQRLQEIIQGLDEQQIDFDCLTLDWFALEPGEICVIGNTLLINEEHFKGALTGELAPAYIQDKTALCFQDSSNAPAKGIKIDEPSSLWIARRLLKRKPLNLCQGAMQHGNKSDGIKQGLQLAVALCGFWLVSILIVNAWSLYSLNHKTKAMDERIAVIYKQFFPEAKQVISPKFRIENFLKGNSTNGQARFWFLLNRLAKAVKNSHVRINDLRYQNNTLLVTLTSTDFPNLERIENELKTLQLKVKQTQASTQNEQVVATLELT